MLTKIFLLTSQLNYLWLLWLLLAVFFLVVEIVSVALLSIWFVVGALVAMVAALLGAPVWLQILLMVVVSIACILIFYFNRERLGILPSQRPKTNADALLGLDAEVIQEIVPQEDAGQVRVRGQVWSARSADAQYIAAGEIVKVVDLTGVKLTVERKN